MATFERYELTVQTDPSPPTGNVKNAIRQYGLGFFYPKQAAVAAMMLSRIDGVVSVEIKRVVYTHHETWQQGKVV